MRCEKLRRIYFKYIDGELSGRKARLLEEHVRDCSICAAEVESIERMRSLLQTAGQVEIPDAYWDTYWDRLEKKLPDRPSPVSLKSRILAALASLLRRPAVLGRVAIYALFLAILVYTTPDHPFRKTIEIAPDASIPAPVSLRAAEELESHDDMKGIEVTEGIELDLQPSSRGRTDAGLAKKKAETAILPAEDMKDEEQAGSGLRIPTLEAEIADAEVEKTKNEAFSRAAPAKPATALKQSPDKPLIEAESQPHQIVENEEEYVAADKYFREGQYPQAIISYQNFIVANRRADMNDERMLRAVYQLGEANYQIGNYSEALSSFVAVTNEEIPETLHMEDDQMMRRARTRSRMVSRPQAGKEFKEANSVLKAKHSATGRESAAMYYGIGQSEGLPETREELISLAVFRQAESYEHLGKLKEALAKYREYVEKYPSGKYVSQAKEKIAQVAR